jgi:hypothetical protein
MYKKFVLLCFIALHAEEEKKTVTFKIYDGVDINAWKKMDKYHKLNHVYPVERFAELQTYQNITRYNFSSEYNYRIISEETESDVKNSLFFDQSIVNTLLREKESRSEKQRKVDKYFRSTVLGVVSTLGIGFAWLQNMISLEKSILGNISLCYLAQWFAKREYEKEQIEANAWLAKYDIEEKIDLGNRTLTYTYFKSAEDLFVYNASSRFARFIHKCEEARERYRKLEKIRESLLEWD